MLNTLPVQAAVRQPRAIVRIAGTAVDGWIKWSATNNSYFEADTFDLQFAISQLPSSNDANWFSQQSEIFIEVLAGFPSNPDQPTAGELTSLIYGRIDTIEFDPTATVLTLTGRDLTAAFIDKKLTTQYQNQTASAAVTQLAQSHGLSTDQITSTTALIGTYLNKDQVQVQATQSEWDFICWLAREEGFVTYVTAQSLYFGPDQRDSSDPYVIQWDPPTSDQASPSANVRNLSFSRSMTVAKGITVTVRSPSTTSKTATVQSYPSAPKAAQAGKAGPFGNVQTYYYNVEANLTPQQVEARAEKLYSQIVSHAMKFSAELPGDVLMTLSQPIQVKGTGTAFDQTYYARQITRSMSSDEGFAMNVEAQNTTPELEGAQGDQ